MANDLLTLDQIYNSPPVAKAAEAPPKDTSEGLFTLKDLYGPEPLNEADLTKGAAAKTTLKEAGKKLAYTTAEVVDMFNPKSIAAGVVGSGAEVATRITSALTGSGGNREMRSENSRQLREDVQSAGGAEWLQRGVQKLLGDTEATPGLAQDVMTGIFEKVDKGGKWLEHFTNGLSDKNDPALVANALMNLGMARAGSKAGKFNPDLADVLKREKETPESPAEAKSTDTPPESPYEARVRKAKQTPPKSKAQQDIEATTGLADAEARKKTFQKQRDDARAAYSDDAEWGAYMARHAEGEAKATAEEAATMRDAGTTDPKMIAALGAGATGLALAVAYPDEGEKGMALVGLGGMIGAKGMHAGESLGTILSKGHNTLLTLERLSANRVEITRQMIEEQLRRPDVTKAEKGVFEAALKDVPAGESIKTNELVGALQRATGDFELKGKETSDFADYGLESLDRTGADSGPWIPEGATREEEARLNHEFEEKQARVTKSRTTIWKLPDHLDLGRANHFDEPGYFGHTRSFDEGGVKHVVEIQSDLAQKAKQRLTEEEVSQLTKDRDAAAERNSQLNGILFQLKNGNGKEAVKRVRSLFDSDFVLKSEVFDKEQFGKLLEKVAQDDSYARGTLREFLGQKNSTAGLRWQEINAKLNAHENIPSDISRISPTLKDWPKRLIREELAASARNGEPVVRFGTADTVAKVEGWPKIPASETHIPELKGKAVTFPETGDKGVLTGYVRNMLLEGDQPSLEWEDPKTKELFTSEVQHFPKEIYDLVNKHPAAKFFPEHQSIYDRYAKDITKFLKNLGGKEITDEHGHTWIETPTGAGKGPSGRAQMFGRASPEQLKNLALLAVGGTIGANIDTDNPIIGAFLGAGSLLTLGNVSPSGIGKAVKAIFKPAPDTRTRINSLTNELEYNVGAGARIAYQVGTKIQSLVPKKERRIAIHQAIDEGKIHTLAGKELEAAKLAQSFYEQVAEAAQKLGVLDSARVDYSTHLWDKADRAKLDALMQASSGPSMSPNSRFNKQRIIITTKMGKEAGLKPVTEDISEIISIYGNSMSRTMANKMFLDKLKRAETVEGNRLVAPAGKAPAGYQSINHPQLQGVRIHPDIVPSVKFLFEAQEPGQVMAAVSAVNTALKRNAVSFSLFHVKALVDAFVGAASNPLSAGKVVAQAALPKIFGTNRYLKQLKEGGAGDLVDSAIRDGLKFSYEKSESVVGDVGGGFYSGMKDIQNWMDKKLPGNVGKHTVGNYLRINHAFDNFMWGRLHAAMKLEIYAAKKEALVTNNAKAGKPISERSAGEIAARYTNDIFGGLNWRRMAENSKTKWGRDVALSALSPAGRRTLQILMFAPDWTLSTTRAFVKTFGEGSGVKGIFSATKEADLYRQQLLRSAILYATVGDAINYYNSGHHLWENDPKVGYFYVDLGDGRKMQLSKHFTEPFHWMPDLSDKNPLASTGQQALNKLGVVPKEAATQLLGQEYLSAKGKAPPMDTSPAGRAAHIAKNALPIGVNQMNEGMASGASGALGFPIYGKTVEQRRAEAKARRERDFQKRLQQYKKANGLE